MIERLPPLGTEIVRLPWSVPRPVPEPLRAIVNRATDRQERQRYRNARTLQRALEGWLKVSAEQEGGPLALLLDRLRAVGVLPAQPGGAERVAHLVLLERGRTSELAEIVLDDLALTFELLRQVNVAQVHGAQVSGDGPVLMLRRAIAMLGLEGVRRAALSLRPWPGPMNEEAATEMAALIRRVKRAGRVAVRLAPAGYDPEVTMLIALMQNLGRLVVQYHFPDESAQIRRLTQAADGPTDGAASEPGMSAEAASFAVLGTDVEELGLAVARHWGLDESVLHMIRRLSPTAPVRHPEGDNEMLRTTASCANDLVEALAQPARARQHGLECRGQPLFPGPEHQRARDAGGAAGRGRCARRNRLTRSDLRPARAHSAASGRTQRRPGGLMAPLRHPLGSPNRIGRFELRSELGRGAQATVWLGYDPQLQREVAVKIIHPDADAGEVDAWLHEARLMATLTHPGIVTVHEAGRDADRSFLVLERIEGPTLAQRLRSAGAMPVREAAVLMSEVLDALAFAHQRGVVHRDLKPSNVLLCPQGRPRVMDFGIAARVASAHDGRIVGTPGYISPEAAAGLPPSAAMDVYAAGMLLGHLLLAGPCGWSATRCARCDGPRTRM